MSEMIERAAAAINAADAIVIDGASIVLGANASRILARAVIATIREPTPAMVVRGGNKIAFAAGKHCVRSAREVYQTMIDAALEE